MRSSHRHLWLHVRLPISPVASPSVDLHDAGLAQASLRESNEYDERLPSGASNTSAHPSPSKRASVPDVATTPTGHWRAQHNGRRRGCSTARTHILPNEHLAPKSSSAASAITRALLPPHVATQSDESRDVLLRAPTLDSIWSAPPAHTHTESSKRHSSRAQHARHGPPTIERPHPSKHTLLKHRHDRVFAKKQDASSYRHLLHHVQLPISPVAPPSVDFHDAELAQASLRESNEYNTTNVHPSAPQTHQLTQVPPGAPTCPMLPPLPLGTGARSAMVVDVAAALLARTSCRTNIPSRRAIQPHLQSRAHSCHHTSHHQATRVGTSCSDRPLEGDASWASIAAANNCRTPCVRALTRDSVWSAPPLANARQSDPKSTTAGRLAQANVPVLRPSR
jgi:hypothetical protein